MSMIISQRWNLDIQIWIEIQISNSIPNLENETSGLIAAFRAHFFRSCSSFFDIIPIRSTFVCSDSAAIVCWQKQKKICDLISKIIAIAGSILFTFHAKNTHRKIPQRKLILQNQLHHRFPWRHSSRRFKYRPFGNFEGNFRVFWNSERTKMEPKCVPNVIRVL